MFVYVGEDVINCLLLVLYVCLYVHVCVQEWRWKIWTRPTSSGTAAATTTTRTTRRNTATAEEEEAEEVEEEEEGGSMSI